MNRNDTLRIVVADDSVLVRRGVVELLQEAGCDVVAEAGDAGELLRAVATERPDVAVVDIRMPPTHTDEGILAAGEIRRLHPHTGVLVLSQYVEEAYASRVLAEAPGGVGYLLKESVRRVSDLMIAARRVAEGGTVVDPAVVKQLMARRRAAQRVEALSAAERAVMELVAEGYSNVGIAEKLFLSPRTVESHLRAIFAKLGLQNAPDVNRRVRAVLALLEERQVEE
jgi:serine/threonine-protein kinase